MSFIECFWKEALFCFSSWLLFFIRQRQTRRVPHNSNFKPCELALNWKGYRGIWKKWWYHSYSYDTDNLVAKTRISQAKTDGWHFTYYIYFNCEHITHKKRNCKDTFRWNTLSFNQCISDSKKLQFSLKIVTYFLNQAQVNKQEAICIYE